MESLVGQNVRKLRGSLQLSQERLAVAAGLCADTVVRLERTGNVSLQTLQGIAKALEVDVVDLFREAS